MQTNTQFDHNSRIWYLRKFSGSWEELLKHGQRSLTHGQVYSTKGDNSQVSDRVSSTRGKFYWIRAMAWWQVATCVTPPFHQLRLQDSADFGSKVGNLSRKAPRGRCPTHVGSAAGGANFARGMPILAHSCPLPVLALSCFGTVWTYAVNWLGIRAKIFLFGPLAVPDAFMRVTWLPS